MTYAVFTLLCIALGVGAVFLLLRREMPNVESLRVDWSQSPSPPAGPQLLTHRGGFTLPGEEPPPGAIPLKLTGPDRYCPTCGRLLVRVHEDGRFDLMGKTTMSATGEVELAPGAPFPPQLEGLLVEAICLRCEPEKEQ